MYKLHETAGRFGLNGRTIEFQVPPEDHPTYLLRPVSDSISNEIIKNGGWEKHLLDMAKKYIKPDSNILDIGANIGGWAVPLSKMVPQGKVFAFEPQTETFKQLCANLWINQCSNVTPFQYALGTMSESGQTLTMTVDPFNNGSGMVAGDGKIDEERIHLPKVTVQMKALDEFTDSLPKIDFLKIDVEGYEKKVFLGGSKLLRRDRPVIFLEILPLEGGKTSNEILATLNDFGYQVYHISKDDYYAIPVREPIPEITRLTIQSSSSIAPSKSNWWWIWILISFGIVVVLGIVAFGCIKYWKKKRNSKK